MLVLSTQVNLGCPNSCVSFASFCCFFLRTCRDLGVDSQKVEYNMPEDWLLHLGCLL